MLNFDMSTMSEQSLINCDIATDLLDNVSVIAKRMSISGKISDKMENDILMECAALRGELQAHITKGEIKTSFLDKVRRETKRLIEEMQPKEEE
ncbi:hypothetical protein CCZ01_05220 [Helicobacter monodelphidis]|uniref:hypothetical protein n=1 Tax=Helicobacter sp. 15-1451 TaxID=2004995 RepID=UPI000DCE04FA|nr:hypothetical protein [Helicobacter sp. 15-1451]RAX57689.1 hypothetical protein CCZ01_05220 [Helicobacter sp. 15-1451]